MSKILWASAAAVALVAAAPAMAGPVLTYTGDSFTGYDGTVGILTHSGGGLADTVAGSWTSAGWDGKFFRNSTTGLTTMQAFNLPTHSQITLSFLVGLLDSWDSTDGSPAPDLLYITIDGNLVATLTVNNAGGSVIDTGGGTILAYRDQIDSNYFYSDTLIDMSTASWATFAHSADTLTIGFQAGGNGWQGGTDEAWGFDNMTISIDGVPGVPEPASWAMMMGGLGIVGAAMRRRRTAVSFA